MVFAAVNSSDIDLAVLIGIAIIVGFFTLVRGRADVWKSNYEGEKERGDNLQKALDDERLSHSKTKESLAKAESQPNMNKLVEMMNTHDDRAAKRNKEVIIVLKKIADNIPGKQ